MRKIIINLMYGWKKNKKISAFIEGTNDNYKDHYHVCKFYITKGKPERENSEGRVEYVIEL
jgi:hypothetical protein